MKLIETPIADLKEIEIRSFADERGYFFESFHHARYQELLGLSSPFVQDNVSFSKRGVLRGLHFQNPQAQGKLVSVLQGEVLDVAVDIRVGSPTFGQWHGVVLNDKNHKQFWVPRGFAHGFIVLSDTALFSYKCDQYYSPMHEGAIIWNDPDLNIDWRLNDAIVSGKDGIAPNLKDIDPNSLPQYEANV